DDIDFLVGGKAGLHMLDLLGDGGVLAGEVGALLGGGPELLEEEFLVLDLLAGLLDLLVTRLEDKPVRADGHRQKNDHKDEFAECKIHRGSSSVGTVTVSKLNPPSKELKKSPSGLSMAMI